MSLPQITITLTRYAEPDWLILDTLESLTKQKNIEGEVLFLDQTDNTSVDINSLNRTTQSLRFKRILIPAKSLSYARNKAIEWAENDIILYIDSDAIADTTWAYHLARALLDENAAIAGGKIILKWHKKPLWIAKASVVHEQYSSLDLGDGLIASSKVVGASFGLNRSLLGKDAYFDEQLGRREGKLISGEESDLCARASSRGLKVVYQGASVVQHQVLPERVTYSWILNRMYYAGASRSKLGGAPSPTHKPKFWDYACLPLILPSYTAGFLMQWIKDRI